MRKISNPNISPCQTTNLAFNTFLPINLISSALTGTTSLGKSISLAIRVASSSAFIAAWRKPKGWRRRNSSPNTSESLCRRPSTRAPPFAFNSSGCASIGIPCAMEKGNSTCSSSRSTAWTGAKMGTYRLKPTGLFGGRMFHRCSWARRAKPSPFIQLRRSAGPTRGA